MNSTTRFGVIHIALLAGLIGATGCHAKPAPAISGKVLARPANTDLFATAQLDANRTTYTTRGTSFTGAINTAALERIIKQRLRDVEMRALQDLLKNADVSTKPVKDLLAAAAGIIVEVSDLDTKSQALATAMFRDGLSLGIADLAEDNLLPANGCPIDLLADAAYEGLAQSAYLRLLGFTEATGMVDPACERFAQDAALLADALSRLTKPAHWDSFTKQLQETLPGCIDVAKAAAIKTTITSTLEALPITSTGIDLSKMGLSSIRRLVVALAEFARAGEDATPDATCNARLADLMTKYEASVGQLASDAQADITLSMIEATVRKYEVIVKNALGNKGTIQLRDLLVRLVDGQALRRGDVVFLVSIIKRNGTSKIKSDEAKEIIEVILDTIPQSVQEDETAKAGLRLDIPALATSALSRYSQSQRDGWYIRANIGTGYLFQSTPPGGATARAALPTFYEEIGFGHRWASSPVLMHGPQLITSGILYQITSASETKDTVFIGAGYSLNVYRLIEVSANVGPMFTLGKDEARVAAFVGIQLPLIDYVNAIAEGSAKADTESAEGKK